MALESSTEDTKIDEDDSPTCVFSKPYNTILSSPISTVKNLKVSTQGK